MTISRHLRVHVRAGANLETESGGTYVILRLDDEKERTKPAKGLYPVWNQTLKFPLADASPDEESPTLKVKVKQNNYLRFDKTVGKGTLSIPLVYGPGLHETKVPLTGAEGAAAGFVHLGVEVVEGGIDEVHEPPPVPAGGLLSGLPSAQGKAELAKGGAAEFLPSATTTPVGPQSGALAAGQLADPSQPAYGVL
ncbi:hypothetical protein ACKKBG_A17040 [Auxenochlorella protothecoides x Auxenochlorella symbiontica]|uniref:C2 domain-containing protein n=2 Tax=Auxenochlorella protothecoides TaxID=3075 RepID=A0A087SFK1_AUXPR|nr:hypothetical protein F751_3223 [Auxenochlorella protothecoides]KFM24505.1 hypothetical protein F751_3223 [Auxenochlorella protothecoides]RMZ54408.1 hypothetical protein APUTEX25_001984 [Auxenochlorella protothecoides]|eukprot:RMZ54408.1 hypothetical protein APUTEX25_001984 [Auxenochlorella protothecoides]